MNIKLKRFIVIFLPPALIALFFICASFVVRHISFPQCFFNKYLGIYCPGCGITRAVKALLRGDIVFSLRNNFMVLGGIVLGALYYLEYALKVFGKKVRFKFLHKPVLIYGFLIFLGVFAVLRNFIPAIAPA